MSVGTDEVTIEGLRELEERLTSAYCHLISYLENTSDDGPLRQAREEFSSLYRDFKPVHRAVGGHYGGIPSYDTDSELATLDDAVALTDDLSAAQLNSLGRAFTALEFGRGASGGLGLYVDDSEILGSIRRITAKEEPFFVDGVNGVPQVTPFCFFHRYGMNVGANNQVGHILGLARDFGYTS